MSKKNFSATPFKLNEEIEVEISDLAYGGDSIAKYNNFTIFTPYGVPGSKVKIKITEIKKDFARGKIVKLIKNSPIFKQPECKFFGLCGGCDWMNVVYNEQCKFKEKILKHMLENIADIKNFIPDKIIKNEPPLFYRNRVQYKLTKDKKSINLGFFKARSHEIVKVDKCFILKEKLNIIADKIYNVLNIFKDEISIYDENNQKGYLRYICLRANKENEVLATFVIAKKDIKNWLNKITDILSKEDFIKGIIVNFNFEKGNKIFGEKEKVLYGNSFIIEKIREVLFKLDSFSFFQVNTFMLEKMVEFIDKNTFYNSNVLDLYGGVGALTLPLNKKFKKIIVVEVEKNATDKLNETIKLNNLKNTRVINAKAEDIIEKVIREQKIDEIILDPPRKGLHPHIIFILNKIKPEKIIYISCNPASFSRDIYQLKHNYLVKKITPLDQFSQTYHLEVMSVLERKKI